MRPILMSDAVLRCQRRADMEGDGMISPPEWKQLISEQYVEIYSLVKDAGLRHFENTQTITGSGASTYALSADHDDTIGVERVIDTVSGRKIPLGEVTIQERTRFSGLTGDAIGYSLVGQSVALFPVPSSGTYLHIYVPQAIDLSSLADSSTFDVVTGWGEPFLYWGVAVKALAKRKQDPTLAIAERNDARDKFMKDVEKRAMVNPRKRIPMPTTLDWNAGGGWPGGGPDGWGYDPGGWWNR